MFLGFIHKEEDQDFDTDHLDCRVFLCGFIRIDNQQISKRGMHCNGKFQPT